MAPTLLEAVRSSELSKAPATRRAREQDESDADKAPAAKRPRFTRAVASHYPWEEDDAAQLATLDPELRRTLLLLRLYTEDPHETKRSLLNAAHVPGFPEPEWTNVLAGAPVDLDRVLSSLLTSAPDTAPPSRRVASFSDWVFAFEHTIKATCFAFRHREREMDAYRRRMSRTFAIHHSSLHPNIIELDKAIRKRAGMRRDLLLDDHTAYEDIRDSYLSPSGIYFPKNFQTGGGGGSEFEKRKAKRAQAAH